MRKVPKAAARNGAVRPWNELNQPSVRIVSTFAISVTSIGSIKVAMKATKATLRNGNRRNANAYAASTEVTTCAVAMMAVMPAEVRSRVSRSCWRKARENALHSEWTGQGGCVEVRFAMGWESDRKRNNQTGKRTSSGSGFNVMYRPACLARRAGL